MAGSRTKKRPLTEGNNEVTAPVLLTADDVLSMIREFKDHLDLLLEC